MTPRQRGACWLLLLILAGRLLDALDLPFERMPSDASPQILVVSGSTARSTSSQATFSPASAAPESAETASTAPSPIRINHATLHELQALPGVGPVLAGRIVAYRAEHGPLRNLTETRRIKGIGARMLQRLAPLLRFD